MAIFRWPSTLWKCASASIGLFCYLPASFGNDTTAELAVGGLLFTKSAQIEMRAEDLFLSTKEVRVRYQFYNNSADDVVTQVAFPIPDIPYGADDFNFALPTDNPENIFGFETIVNGQPVGMRVERKAYVGDKDLTEILNGLGIPVVAVAGQPLASIPRDKWSELTSAGLAKREDNGSEGPRLYPTWTLKTTYHWQQIFPAHRITLIDHRYRPSVGSAVTLTSSELLANKNLLGIGEPSNEGRFCIDKSLIASIKGRGEQRWLPQYLQYILVTGANWVQPIRRFRLVIDKESQDSLVSFCGQNVRKISPTQFEVMLSDFVPSSNLNVLILKREKREQRIANSLESSAASTCDMLWQQRNAIFKASGYCFRSARAIDTFSNEGCRFRNVRDVPLSQLERTTVREIGRREAALHCTKDVSGGEISTQRPRCQSLDDVIAADSCLSAPGNRASSSNREKDPLVWCHPRFESQVEKSICDDANNANNSEKEEQAAREKQKDEFEHIYREGLRRRVLAELEKNTPVEFEQLLYLFMQKSTDQASSPYWTVGSESGTNIRWLHDGLKDCDEKQLVAYDPFCRSGEVLLTISGKPTHSVLKRTVQPGVWNILLAGAKAGITHVYIDSDVNSQELEPGLIRKIVARSGGKMSLTSIKECDHAVLYRIAAKNYRSAFVVENSSCGSAGCAIGLILTYGLDDAKASIEGSCQ